MADRAVGIPIVKEGLPFVGILAGVTLATGLLGWVIPAGLLGGVTAFTVWFFRNPYRTIPTGTGAVVAPGDGKMIAIEEEFEPRYLKDKSIRLSIFLNVFDVHVNRIPCAGVIEGVQYQPGCFVPANKPDALSSERAKCADDSHNLRGQGSVCTGRGTDCQTNRLLGGSRRSAYSVGERFGSDPFWFPDGYLPARRHTNTGSRG